MMYWDDIKTVLFQSVFEWPVYNKKQTKEISHDTALKMFKVLIFLCLINVIILLLKPWFLNELPLALHSESINFWIIYSIQAIHLTYVLVLMFGFDIIYVSVCIFLINNFRHLACLFENLTYLDYNEMKEGVRRHVVLMR